MKSLSDVMAFWGRIWKLLPGDAFIRLEATDSIIVAGPISDSMREAETDPSHFHTCNPLRACLFAAGISNENLAGYEAALKSGRYLVIVQGNRQEVPEAASILKSSGCFGVAKARKAELSALKRAARNPAKVMDKTSDPIPLQHE